MTKTTEPDLVAEVEALLAHPDIAQWAGRNVRELLRRLVEEVKQRRNASTDAVIQKIQIMQEKYPGQRIEISIEPDGYCCVTRVDRDALYHPIAEGATLGDVFED